MTGWELTTFNHLFLVVTNNFPTTTNQPSDFTEVMFSALQQFSYLVTDDIVWDDPGGLSAWDDRVG
jgi:hypothetical protein